MKRGTIVIALFIVVALAIFGANYFFNSQPPIEITISADPLIEDWLRQSITDFNNSAVRTNSGRTVQVTLDFENDYEVWSERLWSSSNHPDGWIPAITASVDYATNAGMPFEITHDSIAKTPLMLAGFASRVEVLTGDQNLDFDWNHVVDAASVGNWADLGGNPNWQFDLAFALPGQSAVGLGTLMSAVANIEDTGTITRNEFNSESFRQSFAPVVDSVSNYNSIGADVAIFMARNSSTSDIGMATESQWLNSLNALMRKENMIMAYPEYTVMFNFPLALWDDIDVDEEIKEAVRTLGGWFLEESQQSTLNDFGLRTSEGSVNENAELFVNAESSGVQSEPELDNLVSYPPRNSDVDELLNWFNSARR